MLGRLKRGKFFCTYFMPVPILEEVFLNKIAELFRYNALAALRNCTAEYQQTTLNQQVTRPVTTGNPM